MNAHPIVPEPALGQHINVVGKTGSGKTYTAKVIVEGLLAKKRRVCIIDPTGAWYGLKSSADGKRPGFPIVVFGGDHADVPISDNAGAAVAEMVGTRNMPAIVDLSEFGMGEKQRFIEAFAAELLRVNRQPLHLVIDEADEFAPQNALPDQKRMLGTIDRIVRRGRRLGFRVIMITQRPAVIHKNVFTQAATMIVHRLPAPQDRKAVEEWIKGQADAEQGAQVLASLSRLERGEAWVWFPEGGVLESVRVGRITTFDSGRTPDDGEAIEEPTSLAQVDLTAISAAMQEAIKAAAENDPKALREKIAELERDLEDAKAGRAAAPPDPAIEQELVVAKRELEASSRSLADAAAAIERYQTMVDQIHHALDGVSAAAPKAPPPAKIPVVVHPAIPPDTVVVTNGREIAVHRFPPAQPTQPPRVASLGVPKGYAAVHQKILDAVQFWNAIGVQAPKLVQVGAAAGYALGGTLDKYVGFCSSNGLIERRDGHVYLTREGSRLANRPKLPSLAEWHSRVFAIVEGPHQKLLDAVIRRARHKPVPTEVIGRDAGYAPGGTLDKYVGRLSALELIKREKGTITATSVLFPEGLQ